MSANLQLQALTAKTSCVTASPAMLWCGGNALDALGPLLGKRTINTCPQMTDFLAATLMTRQVADPSKLTQEDWTCLSAKFACTLEGNVDVFFALPFSTATHFSTLGQLEASLLEKIFFTHELPTILAARKVSSITVWGVYGFTQLTNEEVDNAKARVDGPELFQRLLGTRRRLGSPIHLDSCHSLEASRRRVCRRVMDFFGSYDAVLDADSHIRALVSETFDLAPRFSTNTNLNGVVRAVAYDKMRIYARHLAELIASSP
jgi:hypothetical protein